MDEPAAAGPAPGPPGLVSPGPGDPDQRGPGPGAAAGDAELIAASRAEPEAFAAIFDRHAATIHRYAARRLGQAAADDVVGETFLVAFRRRERYDPAYQDARPWLFGIATNVIGRHRQAEVRFYRALARTGVDPVIDSPADEVVARVAATAARRSLAAALARLTAADRNTLLLVTWGQCSYDQAAGALGIPVGTVRSRLNRARRKLREALDGISSLTEEEAPAHE